MHLFLSGEDVFATGMAYVALSRARTLPQLVLHSFERDVIVVDEAVLEAYATMRARGLTDVSKLRLRTRKEQ